MPDSESHQNSWVLLMKAAKKSVLVCDAALAFTRQVYMICCINSQIVNTSGTVRSRSPNQVDVCSTYFGGVFKAGKLHHRSMARRSRWLKILVSGDLDPG